MNFNIADGFAITTSLYDIFLEQNQLTSKIENKLTSIDIDDIEMLEHESTELKNMVVSGVFTEEQEQAIIKGAGQYVNTRDIGDGRTEVS
jgi:pyruvate,water dikinase